MSSKISPPTENDRRGVAFAGRCASCRHLQVLRSGRGSTFVRCALSDQQEAFQRYPRLPVLACGGWELWKDLDETS